MRLLAFVPPAVVVLAACTPARMTAPAPVEPRPVSYPFQDPDLPLETRLTSLVSLLTVDEKVGQLMNAAPAVERLGIPAYDWWNEALHGVARAGRATVFPQAIGLAATWDTTLMFRVATAISVEARAKHHESLRQGRHGIYEGLTFWSPNINIFRDPRWGRGMETYGEDPFLSGRQAVAFVRGIQGDDPRYLRAVATPKHYAVHSGPEPDRHRFDAVVGERDLRETYLPAFEAAVTEGGAWSVMCAYNRVDGAPACGSRRLLQEILREEWGFPGYVVSDCGAIDDIRDGHRLTRDSAEAAAMGLRAGTDLECGRAYRALGDAVRRGLITEQDLDVALRRLFRARFRLGMFDPPERVPFASIPYRENDSPAHRALAIEAARRSLVLLKNAGGLLPLRRDLRTLAVIGPNADDVDVLLGNYNGQPSAPVTPVEGIRRAAGSRMRVLSAQGSDWAVGMPVLRVVPHWALRVAADGQGAQGLAGAYYDNQEFTGAPVATRTDAALDFTWWEDAPVRGMRADSFSVRWSGALVPPVTGRYAVGLRAQGGVRLFLGDSLLLEWSDRHVVVTQWASVDLVAGVPRPIRVEYFDRRADASVQLVWSVPDPRLREEAVATAMGADAVVMVLGLSPRLEGEEMPVAVPGFSGGDRTDVALPAPQQELLEAVVATGKPVVLVLLNGSALGVTWAAEHVAAIVEAWYPGQAAGTAIADVLFGAANPAGRLPVTFYRSVEQVPPFTEYGMAGRTYRYFRGEPLFPFGHGLSYTRFRYRDLRIAGAPTSGAPPAVRAGDSVTVSVEVENAGAVLGEEVVQLYVTDLEASVPVPVRSLQGFVRIALQPGQRHRVAFTLAPRQLSLIDTAGRRVVEPGTFEIGVGGKQPGFRGVADAATTEVRTGRFEVVGAPFPVPR
ncbi:MAG: glycoside hydrolase family 3 C-terminal domain-containing protein [Gemmatimonadota bacterium]